MKAQRAARALDRQLLRGTLGSMDKPETAQPAKALFVGRKNELDQWRRVLALPIGQGILVVGQQGMGKTVLLGKMEDMAREHPSLKCGAVRYEVTRTDAVNTTMDLMLDHAFEAAQVKEGSFAGTERRLAQWRAFLNVFQIGDLVMSLRRDPQRDTRDQFLDRLEKVSAVMPDNGRAVFFIDPEKHLPPGSDEAWTIVVRKLPPKVKLVFAQRPDDCLAGNAAFTRLPNVVRIPPDDLHVLDEQAVDDLLQLRAPRIGVAADVLRKAVERYNRHPYAIPAALDLIQQGVPIEELPNDPTNGIAAAQWRAVCAHSTNAIRLFKAYAALEVAVPDEVVGAVSRLDGDTRGHLTADAYLGGLIRREADGARIYHSLLADHVLREMEREPEDCKGYQRRAIDLYRRRLAADGKPDALAAVRLPEHVLRADGGEAFVHAFVNECTKPLLTLGLLDAATRLSEAAMAETKPGSASRAALLGNLGLICQTRGDLDEAEKLHRQALVINKQLGRREGMAIEYGNLGLICQTRGDLDEAEKLHRQALVIEEQLGRREGMANAYGNLGLIYRKRGDLDEAEKLHRQALAIFEQLGQREGMANAYGNLGVIYEQRGDLEQARALWRQARDLVAQVGMKRELAEVEGWLADLGA